MERLASEEKNKQAPKRNMDHKLCTEIMVTSKKLKRFSTFKSIHIFTDKKGVEKGEIKMSGLL